MPSHPVADQTAIRVDLLDPTGVTPVERVLASLLLLEGVEQTLAAALRGVRDCTGASWAAFFSPEGERLVCRAVDGSGPRVGAVVARPRSQPGVVVHGWAGAVLRGDLWESAVTLLLEVDDHTRVVLVLGPRPDGRSYDAASVRLLERLGGYCARALHNAALVERLRSQAFVDVVTDCYNRRGFEEHLQMEMVRARRYRRPVSLLLIDLDHFKRTNDELGHLIGDYVLRSVGNLLRSAFRDTDVVCRYGGDEFAVIFPETLKTDVARLAERLREMVGTLFPDAILPGVVTASCGVASYPEDASEADELVRAADHALYRAKSEGRDRVVLA